MEGLTAYIGLSEDGNKLIGALVTSDGNLYENSRVMVKLPASDAGTQIMQKLKRYTKNLGKIDKTTNQRWSQSDEKVVYCTMQMLPNHVNQCNNYGKRVRA